MSPHKSRESVESLLLAWLEGGAAVPTAEASSCSKRDSKRDSKRGRCQASDEAGEPARESKRERSCSTLESSDESLGWSLDELVSEASSASEDEPLSPITAPPPFKRQSCSGSALR